MTSGLRDLQRRRSLGRGLQLIPVGDLGRDLTMTADGADFAMVDGVENLAQSLSVAVLTPLGADMFNTAFGFDGLNALVEESAAVMQRERVRVSIVQLLQRDARVRRIVDVRLVDSRLDAPTTGAARELDVRVVFEVTSGDQLTLSAGTSGTRITNG